MLDIKDKTIKVSLAKPEQTSSWADELMCPSEFITMGFSSSTHNIVFTNKRIIIMSSEGISSKKKVFTSIPYSSISYFSIDTAGIIINSTGLELYVKDYGLLKIQFNSETDIKEIGRILASNIN